MITRTTKSVTLTAIALGALLLALAPVSAEEPAVKGPVQIPASADAGWETQAPKSAGSLGFDHDTHDFGTVEEGSIVNATFTFTNNGTSPVKIESITAGCGCTVPKQDLVGKEFPPGSGGEIAATFNSHNKAGQNRTVAITVTTNDANNPTYRLNIKGNVVPTLYLSERVLQFEEINQGTPSEKSFEVIDLGEKPATIQKAEAYAKGVEVVVGESSPYKDEASGRSGRKTTVTVKVPADFPTGNLAGPVTVYTDNEKSPQLVTQLRGRVKGDIDVEPSQVFFGAAKPGEQRSSQAVIDVRDDKKFEMTKYEVKDVVIGNAAGPAPELKISAEMTETEMPVQDPNLGQLLAAKRQELMAKGATPEEMKAALEAEMKNNTRQVKKQVLKLNMNAPETAGGVRGTIAVTGMVDGAEKSFTLPFTAVVRNEAARPALSAAGVEAAKAEAVNIESESSKDQLKKVAEKRAALKGQKELIAGQAEIKAAEPAAPAEGEVKK